MAKDPQIKSSFHDHTITTEKFQENTIIRRLKGRKVDDPVRDEDHPRNREDK